MILSPRKNGVNSLFKEVSRLGFQGRQPRGSCPDLQLGASSNIDCVYEVQSAMTSSVSLWRSEPCGEGQTA